jgi:hypothetical protein
MSGTGLGVSFLLHSVALAVLAFAYLSAPPQPVGITVSGSFGPPSAAPSQAVHLATDPSQLTGELVRQKIETLIDRQEGTKPAEQLERLDKISKQLGRVSSGQSVDEMADQFESWLGYAPRATQPVAGISADAFDPDTAQVHDVTRSEDGAGGWRYVAILLDANGCTHEVELTASEGEIVYQLMQRLKASPLLDRIYRRIAMPLFDQIINGVREPLAPAPPSNEPPRAPDPTRGL